MVQGASYLAKGFKLIFSKGFRRYALLPILINILVFASLFGFGLNWFWASFHDYSMTMPGWLSWLEPVMSYLGPILFWIAFIGLGLAMLLTLGSISSLIASILASPFNSYLVEKILTQDKPDHSPSFITVMLEAIARETQKILYYLPRLIGVFIIFALFYFIPVLNLIGSALFFIFSSWILSFEYLDYSAEASNLKFKAYKPWLKSHRSLTYSFGIASMSMASIPFINLLAMPASVAGGALLWLDHGNDNLTAKP